MFWEIIISLILLISCFLTPVNLAFPHLEGEDFGYALFIIFIDIMFAIDIFVNFFMAFEDEHHKVVDQRKEVAMNYLKTWFMIDVLSIIPFDLVMTAIQGDAHAGSAN